MSAVVPTFNEAESLPRLLPRLAKALARCEVPAEIVIADDRSPDGTARIARDCASSIDLPVVVIERAGARSLAESVVEGARAARFRCVVVLDADLSHDPDDVPRLVAPVLSGAADIAIGSRYADGGRISNWPAHRRILSRAGTWPARLLAGVADPLSGFFACRRDLFQDSRLRPRGYKILLELLARFPEIRRHEVPTVFCDRTVGRSKLGIRQKLEFLSQLSSLLAARLRADAPTARPMPNANAQRSESRSMRNA